MLEDRLSSVKKIKRNACPKDLGYVNLRMTIYELKVSGLRRYQRNSKAPWQRGDGLIATGAAASAAEPVVKMKIKLEPEEPKRSEGNEADSRLAFHHKR